VNCNPFPTVNREAIAKHTVKSKIQNKKSFYLPKLPDPVIAPNPNAASSDFPCIELIKLVVNSGVEAPIASKNPVTCCDKP